MTKAEDTRRQHEIDGDFIARTIHDAIEAIPACQRLYPDLYSLDVSKAVRSALEARLNPSNRTCVSCGAVAGEKCTLMSGKEMEKGFHAMRYPTFNAGDIHRIVN